MTIYKVWSSGSGIYPYEEWSGAATSLQALLVGATGLADGDIIHVASDHIAGYVANPSLDFQASVRIISVNRADDSYLPGTTDQECVTGAHMTIDALAHKSIEVQGLKFGCLSSNYVIYVYGNPVKWQFKDCKIIYSPTSDLRHYQQVENYYINCDFLSTATRTANPLFRTLGSASSFFKACSFPVTDNVGNILVANESSTFNSNWNFEYCNLSGYDYILQLQTVPTASVFINNCQLHPSGITAFETTYSGPKPSYDKVFIKNSEPGPISSMPKGLYLYSEYAGEITTDRTVYRAASDGENSWSYKLVSNANTGPLAPLVSPNTFVLKHDATGSKDFYIYFLCNQSDLTDEEVGIEIGWGDESTPSYAYGEFVNTLAYYNEGTAAGVSTYLSSDNSTWTGQGGNTRYRIAVTGLNPTEPSIIFVKFILKHPSASLWVCPNMDLI